MNPFYEVPRKRFLIRILAPSSLVFLFFFFVVGAISVSPEFHRPEGPSRVIPFWQASFLHYRATLEQLLSMPSGCLLGTTVNEFQEGRCDTFWTELFKLGGLAVLPFLITLGFISLTLEELQKTYRRAQKRLEKGTGALQGQVTDPPGATEDIYSWFYCFKPIMVELSSREQIRVYFTSDRAPPPAGTQVMLIEMGTSFGEKRRVGMIYAPHVAVVRGE